MISKATHKKYSCTSATRSNPASQDAEDIQRWVDIGPTNRYAWADGKLSTATYGDRDATGYEIVTFDIGEIFDSVAIFGMKNVETVNLNILVGSIVGGSDYADTIDVTGESELLEIGLPPFVDAFLKIQFLGTSFEVGEIVVGNSNDIEIYER